MYTLDKAREEWGLRPPAGREVEGIQGYSFLPLDSSIPLLDAHNFELLSFGLRTDPSGFHVSICLYLDLALSLLLRVKIEIKFFVVYWVFLFLFLTFNVFCFLLMESFPIRLPFVFPSTASRDRAGCGAANHFAPVWPGSFLNSWMRHTRHLPNGANVDGLKFLSLASC